MGHPVILWLPNAGDNKNSLFIKGHRDIKHLFSLIVSFRHACKSRPCEESGLCHFCRVAWNTLRHFSKHFINILVIETYLNVACPHQTDGWVDGWLRYSSAVVAWNTLSSLKMSHQYQCLFSILAQNPGHSLPYLAKVCLMAVSYFASVACWRPCSLSSSCSLLWSSLFWLTCANRS